MTGIMGAGLDDDDDDRHRSVIGEDRGRSWSDDSPEDVHIPIADEIRMELEREGVISSSE